MKNEIVCSVTLGGVSITGSRFYVRLLLPEILLLATKDLSCTPDAVDHTTAANGDDNNGDCAKCTHVC